MMDQITKEFFQTGQRFEDFVKEGTPDEQKRSQRYYDKSAKDISPEEYKIELVFPVNIVIAATTWCWDSQTNVPILVRIAEHNPKINLTIFNKDRFPFIIDRINNGEKVPQALIYSKDFYYLDRWVERTTYAYKLFAEVYEELGWDKEKKNEFIKEYRKRYLKQHKEINLAVIEEIKSILKRTDAVQASTMRLQG
jgi:hypothetical protein